MASRDHAPTPSQRCRVAIRAARARSASVVADATNAKRHEGRRRRMALQQPAYTGLAVSAGAQADRDDRHRMVARKRSASHGRSNTAMIRPLVATAHQRACGMPAHHPGIINSEIPAGVELLGASGGSVLCQRCHRDLLRGRFILPCNGITRRILFPFRLSRRRSRRGTREERACARCFLPVRRSFLRIAYFPATGRAALQRARSPFLSISS